ncbi:hypothetical protein A7C99_0400 [Trichophyton rubrum]|uniref:Uncharacterized protein n=2 Tax=Trichophyton rubrum TaxID=5551 RepID=A0A178F7S1_TRIRU|nr:uncharacterized protein TERG_07354 [Trichophyton rubrum CBS 118892]EGD91134.2 hypothetical protein TERG_07354 [Trichophyton rubrum CBS 118892]OAL68005.1 hypothetical protein A7C99_0400 [Trichophyton rubrum]DAA75711.1 TPA_exp: Uncharacterized protein A8136_1433 [Trichophyton benhamiae CBS 112371]
MAPARDDAKIWIHTGIKWEATDPSVLKQVVGAKTSSADAQLLSEFELKITLTKRGPKEAREMPHPHLGAVKDGRLLEEAFEPKKYMVRLEKGKFIPALDKDPDGRMKWRAMSPYNYRLVFDKSPYPAGEHWKDPEICDDAKSAHEWKEFHAGSTKYK